MIEYPDGQTKIEIPYKDEDKKAWITVEDNYGGSKIRFSSSTNESYITIFY